MDESPNRHGVPEPSKPEPSEAEAAAREAAPPPTTDAPWSGPPETDATAVGPPPANSGADQSATGRPRSPGAIRIAVALLWLFTAVALVPTALFIIFAVFQLSLNDPLTIAEIRDVLSAPIFAALMALLAIKLWTGRGWARQASLIVVVLSVFGVLAFPGNLVNGPVAIVWIAAAAMIVLLTRPTAREWCDPESPRHSPRIRPAPQPPFRMVAALLLLWAATAYALFLAIGALLSLSLDPGTVSDPARTAWIMTAIAAVALCHIALNIALARHRNWARLGTEVLMAAYAIALVGLAVTAPARDGAQSWAAQLLLALVPLAFIWALRSSECKTWCGQRAGRHGEDRTEDGPGGEGEGTGIG
jgi:hypothetical protein